jgi:hypothetical protein
MNLVAVGPTGVAGIEDEGGYRFRDTVNRVQTGCLLDGKLSLIKGDHWAGPFCDFSRETVRRPRPMALAILRVPRFLEDSQ